jgi:hypothetical protein
MCQSAHQDDRYLAGLLAAPPYPCSNVSLDIRAHIGIPATSTSPEKTAEIQNPSAEVDEFARVVVITDATDRGAESEFEFSYCSPNSAVVGPEPSASSDRPLQFLTKRGRNGHSSRCLLGGHRCRPGISRSMGREFRSNRLWLDAGDGLCHSAHAGSRTGRDSAQA